jgi:aryl-alcohol dehydrogenase
MQITAAVLREPTGRFEIEQLELEPPRDDEVLVRVVGAGLCHTDLLSREWPPEMFPGPIVYGHEGAGVVESVGGAVTHVAEGDHVVLSFDSCGVCAGCRSVGPYACFDFLPLNLAPGRVDGSSALTDSNGRPVGSHFFGQSSLASHAVVSGRSVVKVDPTFALARLGPLGCGVQTGAGAILNTLDVQPGSSVAIYGAGSLGLSAVMAAKVAGAGQIIAVDRHRSRLDMATTYGATDQVTGDPAEILTAVQDLSGGGTDYSFDSTGVAAITRVAFEGLNNTGTMSMAGVGSDAELVFDYRSLISPRTIKGVVEGSSDPATFIPRLAQLNADGEFPFDDLITTYRLDEINEAERASHDGEVVKPVFMFD